MGFFFSSSSSSSPGRCVCNIDCSHISFNPVCASDGRSYDNPCQVKEASCQKQERIEVKYLGHCQGQPQGQRTLAHTHTQTHTPAVCQVFGDRKLTWPTNQGAAEINGARPVDLQPCFISITNIFTQLHFGTTEIILVKGSKTAAAASPLRILIIFWLDDDNPSLLVLCVSFGCRPSFFWPQFHG